MGETGGAVMQRHHDQLGDDEADHGEQQRGPFAAEGPLGRQRLGRGSGGFGAGGGVV